jgi:hypothetical protein
MFEVKRFMDNFSLSIKRVLLRAESVFLRYGAMPRTMFLLAALTALDGFIPMLPAEGFVIALCVLQSQRGIFIVLLFALASATSAYLLALLLGTLNFSAESLGLNLLGEQWDQASSFFQTWGPGSLVFLSAFPDTPRTSIAALALSGVTPEVIFLMVLIGKILLYAGLLGLIHYLPSRLVKWRRTNVFWKKWLQRRASRFVAYCRRIRRLAVRTE